MNYQLEVPPEVREEIKALPGYVRAQARQLIRDLEENPLLDRAKELRGKPNIYRIWLAGQWHIAYQIDEDLKRVRILRVRPKDSIGYEDLGPVE